MITENKGEPDFTLADGMQKKQLSGKNGKLSFFEQQWSVIKNALEQVVKKV